MFSEETIKKAKEGITDTRKLSEVIEKLKNDRTIMPSTLKLIKENQQIQRNVNNIARDMSQSSMGQDVPLNQRRKMQQRQDLIKNMAKQQHTEGDVSCVCMLLKGKTTSYMFSPKELDSAKWSLRGVIIDDHSLVAICNPMSIGKSNEKASKIIGQRACGPIIFMLLDESYVPTNMSVSLFTTIINAVNNIASGDGITKK